MKRFALLTALCLILLPALAPAQPLPVVTGIEPVQYFVQRIGGDMVDVSVMVGPGDEPHSYEPKPSQMTAIAKARLYVAIGVGFENVWLPRFKAANPDLAVVQADMGITKMPMAAHRHGHEHKAESGHGHASLDPHIWTSPALVRNIARTIHLALAKADPANRKAYEANYETFLQEVDLLDSDLRHLFAKVPEGAPFMVYHPAWGYFAREFHLNQIPVEKEGKAPGPRGLAELVDYARANSIRVIFVQPQFSEKSARIIADAIHGNVIKADPMAHDWADNLRNVAEAFRSSFGQ